MKFINYLESITGVGIYPMISLLLFVVFFTAVTWYVLRADKNYMESVSRIPIENDPNEQNI